MFKKFWNNKNKKDKKVEIVIQDLEKEIVRYEDVPENVNYQPMQEFKETYIPMSYEPDIRELYNHILDSSDFSINIDFNRYCYEQTFTKLNITLTDIIEQNLNLNKLEELSEVSKKSKLRKGLSLEEYFDKIETIDLFKVKEIENEREDIIYYIGKNLINFYIELSKPLFISSKGVSEKSFINICLVELFYIYKFEKGEIEEELLKFLLKSLDKQLSNLNLCDLHLKVYRQFKGVLLNQEDFWNIFYYSYLSHQQKEKEKNQSKKEPIYIILKKIGFLQKNTIDQNYTKTGILKTKTTQNIAVDLEESFLLSFSETFENLTKEIDNNNNVVRIFIQSLLKEVKFSNENELLEILEEAPFNISRLHQVIEKINLKEINQKQEVVVEPKENVVEPQKNIELDDEVEEVKNDILDMMDDFEAPQEDFDDISMLGDEFDGLDEIDNFDDFDDNELTPANLDEEEEFNLNDVMVEEMNENNEDDLELLNLLNESEEKLFDKIFDEVGNEDYKMLKVSFPDSIFEKYQNVVERMLTNWSEGNLFWNPKTNIDKKILDSITKTLTDNLFYNIINEDKVILPFSIHQENFDIDKNIKAINEIFELNIEVDSFGKLIKLHQNIVHGINIYSQGKKMGIEKETFKDRENEFVNISKLNQKEFEISNLYKYLSNKPKMISKMSVEPDLRKNDEFIEVEMVYNTDKPFEGISDKRASTVRKIEKYILIKNAKLTKKQQEFYNFNSLKIILVSDSYTFINNGVKREVLEYFNVKIKELQKVYKIWFDIKLEIVV